MLQSLFVKTDALFEQFLPNTSFSPFALPEEYKAFAFALTLRKYKMPIKDCMRNVAAPKGSRLTANYS